MHFEFLNKTYGKQVQHPSRPSIPSGQNQLLIGRRFAGYRQSSR
jgi:hypothetical protein